MRENEQKRIDREIEVEIKSLQFELKSYVYSLVNSISDAEDLVQQTNVFVWERRSEFEPGTSFKAWAFAVARFKVKEFHRQTARLGFVAFSEEMIDLISERAEERSSERAERLVLLRTCMKLLKPKERLLVLDFYVRGNSLTDYAESIGKSVSAVHKAVSRTRMKLRDCINQKLRKE